MSVVGQRCMEVECLYTIDTKLALFKLDCYKVNMLIVVPKATPNKILKNTEKEKSRE